MGRFLTDKHINFNAIRNVIASLWRLKEGMKIHDLGGIDTLSFSIISWICRKLLMVDHGRLNKLCL